MKNSFFTFTEYMNKNKHTPNEEDYIEMIYRLKEEKVTNSLLAKNLNVKPSSITKMIRKLMDKNLLVKSKDEIKLINNGILLGKKLVERHHIIERFLINLGINDNIIARTEKIEHTFDDKIIEKINHFNIVIENNLYIKQLLDKIDK